MEKEYGPASIKASNHMKIFTPFPHQNEVSVD